MFEISRKHLETWKLLTNSGKFFVEENEGEIQDVAYDDEEQHKEVTKLVLFGLKVNARFQLYELN